MKAAISTGSIARFAAALATALCLVAPAQAGAPRYDDLLLSDAKDGAAKAVFTPATPKIFLGAKLVDVPRGTKLTATWIAEKTKAAPPDYKIDSVDLSVGAMINHANFSMTRPNAGWPVGDYRVELSIDGKPASTVRFKVSP